jgi:hypothetical protein
MNWIRFRQANTAITACHDPNWVMANRVGNTVATSGPRKGM